MHISPRTALLSVLAAAVFGGLAFVSFRADPVPVDLAEVTRGPFEVTINADGAARVRDLYEIAAPITGTALRSPVEVGDPVVKGETVVAVVEPVASDLLDPRARREAEAALAEAEAALHVAEADHLRAQEELRFAETQYTRMRALVDRGASSITRLEDAAQTLAVSRAGVEAAVARVDMAKGQIRRAEARLALPGVNVQSPQSCCIQIVAPIDGVVLSIERISGRPVLAGTLLLSIGDPDDLELVADLLSSDAVRLSPGARTYVERWGGDATLMAELDRVDPQARTVVSALGIEEQRVDAYFRLTGTDAAQVALGEGFSVFVRIVEWSADDVVQAPLNAVFRDGDGWAVFVHEDGVAVRRKVEIGRRNDRAFVVRDGLIPGERVITHPSDAIQDGVRVAVRVTG